MAVLVELLPFPYVQKPCEYTNCMLNTSPTCMYIIYACEISIAYRLLYAVVYFAYDAVVRSMSLSHQKRHISRHGDITSLMPIGCWQMR